MADSHGMRRETLLDRMHQAMLESSRCWSGEELGRVFFKLQAQGPAPQGLIRGLLAGDSRFAEDPPGFWSARAAASPPLQQASYLLAWVETGERRQVEEWRLHVAAHDFHASGGNRESTKDRWTLYPHDAEAWFDLRRRYPEHHLATLQAGAVGRLQQWMERRWAFSEWEPVLDLLTWARVELVAEGVSAAESLRAAQPAALGERWRFGPLPADPLGAPLPVLAVLLDHLLEKRGSWTEFELNDAARRSLGSRAVPWDRFDFSPEDLAAVPETSGIYRFRDAEGGLLYVGKAVRLNRRLASYFRPLPPEPVKREELLNALRQFEVVPLPSELEALVFEAASIREHRPLWNVQVEVHPLEDYPPDWWWPLVFVPPGNDPTRASAFVVTAPEQSFLFHLPKEGELRGTESLITWLDSLLAGPEGFGDEEEPPAADAKTDVPAGVHRLEAPETRLVLRYFLRERDRLDRVDALYFTSGQALLEALLALALRAGSGDDPLDQRPSARDRP